ncbi:hypothetical protein ACFFRB_16130 [Kibdelosporangium aridum subsp. largum]
MELVTAAEMTGFVLWPLDDHERQYALAEEVAPAICDALAASPLQ